MPNMFEQQLDPLEVYQRQQYSFADQRRKDVQIEEQKRIDAGRKHLAEIQNKKDNSKNSEASMLKMLLELEQKRVAELEKENDKLKITNMSLKQKQHQQ